MNLCPCCGAYREPEPLPTSGDPYDEIPDGTDADEAEEAA